jgi:serine/threonine-protein kinase RsbW
MACEPAVSLTSTALGPVPFVELKQALPSRIPMISPVVEQLMCFIGKFRNSDGSELDVEMALREALANAIVHGNRQDSRKCVYVTCRCTIDGEVSITVEDGGQGFDPDAVPDPTTAENRLLSEGRGIYLMKRLMDEVRFQQRGAVVYMRKASNERPGVRRKRA